MMVNEVRYNVQRMRQEYREELPKILAQQFSRELTDQEWADLHVGIGRTDLAALGHSMSVRNIRRMYSDTRFFADEKARTEERVKALGGRQFRHYEQKARDLAKFMVTGEIAPGNHDFQRNAYAIARNGDPKAPEADVEAMRSALDRLVTVYALELLDPKARASLEALALEEPEGFDFLVYYASSLRETEAAKIMAAGEVARLNSYKGHVPMETREGLSLVVADDSEFERLTELGYVRSGDYKGSGLEPGKKGYYFSAVAGNSLSPIDLIPDFIPVLGYLDGLLLVPLGIMLAVRMIPPSLMDEFRALALARTGKPTRKAGATMVTTLWLLVLAVAANLVHQLRVPVRHQVFSPATKVAGRYRLRRPLLDQCLDVLPMAEC